MLILHAKGGWFYASDIQKRICHCFDRSDSAVLCCSACFGLYSAGLCSGYLILFFALLAALTLIRLLLLVRVGSVFTAKAVSCIRGVSWCACAIALVFLGMTWYYLVALVLAFTAALLGLCLRVVKNVIEEATAIKSENDLTV